jgi:hypothetical protein
VLYSEDSKLRRERRGSCDSSREKVPHSAPVSQMETLLVEKPWNQKGASRGSTLEPMTMLKY